MILKITDARLYAGIAILILACSGLTSIVFADRGFDYSINPTNALHGSYSSEVPRLPAWDGSYNQPYFVSYDPNNNYVTFSSKQISFTYYKNDCSIKIFHGLVNSNSLPDIGAISWTLKYAEQGNNNFTLVNFPQCESTIQDFGNEFVIHGTFDNHVTTIISGENVTTGQKFDVSYTIPEDGILKSTLAFTNWDSDKINYKWIGTDTEWKIPDVVNLGNSTLVTTSIANEFDLNKTTAPSKITFDSQVPLIYDLGIAKPYLNKTGIIHNSDDTFQLFNDYALSNNNLQIGQTVIIDPTLGYNTATNNYVAVTTASVGTSCGSPSTIVNSNQIYLTDQVSNDVCKRIAYQYDVSVLSNTIIDKVRLIMDTTPTLGQNCDIRANLLKPSTLNALNLWNSNGNGSLYVTNSTICSLTGTNQVIDLGTQAIIDLQNKINTGNKTFSVAIKYNSEIRNLQPHTTNFGNVKLGVLYHTATPSQPLNPIATTSAHKVIINYNMPNYKGSSSITNYNLYKSTFPYAKQPLPSLQGSDQNYALAPSLSINMTKNSIYIPYDLINKTSLITPENSGNALNVKTTSSLISNTYDFSNNTGYTQSGTTVTISGGQMQYNSLDGASNDQESISSPITITSNNYPQIFNGTYHFTSVSSSPSTGIVSLTTGTSNVFTSNTQESIIIQQTACNPTFGIDMNFKDGAGSLTTIGSCTSYQISTGTTYYWSFIRTNSSFATLYLYSNAGHTTLLNSKSGNNIPSSVTGFTKILYGNGFCCGGRSVTGWTDDISLKYGGVSPLIVTGIINNATQFQSINKNSFTFNSSNTGISNSNDFSIMAWVKRTDTSTFNHILGYRNSVSNDISFYVDNTNLNFKNGSSVLISHSHGNSANDWNLLTITRSGNTWSIYDNTTLLSTATISGSIGSSSTNTYRIGVDPSQTTYSNMQLDEFTTFSKAIDATFISNMYNRGITPLIFLQKVGNVTSITDSGLGNGVFGYYRENAINSAGNGTFSTWVNGTTATAPSAPWGGTSTGLSTTSLTLRWHAPNSTNGDPISGYQIQKLTSSGWSTLQNNTGTTILNYNNTGLIAGSQFKYRVGAWNGAGLSAYSANVTGTTLANIPTALIARSINSTKITDNWGTPINGNASLTDYNVTRSFHGTLPFIIIKGHTGNLTNQYQDSGLIYDSKYVYQVRTNNAGGSSLASNNATSATTFIAPTHLNTTALIGLPIRINVTWTNPVVNDLPIEGSQIVRNGTVLVNDTHSSNSFYVDSGLVAGRPQTYKIGLWNLYGLSPLSSSVTGSGAESTSGLAYLNTTEIANVIGVQTRIHLTTGVPNPSTSQIQLYNNSNLLQTLAITQTLVKGNTVYIPVTFNVTLPSLNSISNLTTHTTISNLTGNVIIISNYTAVKPIAIPNQTDPVSGGTYYLNVTRNGALNVMTVQIVRQPINFHIHCLYQWNSNIAGEWHNYTDIAYYNLASPVDPTQTVYGTCFGSGEILNFTSVGQSIFSINGTFTLIQNQFGNFFGAPIIVLLILLFAGLWTGKNANTGLIILAIAVSIFSAVGLIAFSQFEWGLIMVCLTLGVLIGRKFS